LFDGEFSAGLARGGEADDEAAELVTVGATFAVAGDGARVVHEEVADLTRQGQACICRGGRRGGATGWPLEVRDCHFEPGEDFVGLGSSGSGKRENLGPGPGHGPAGEDLVGPEQDGRGERGLGGLAGMR